MKIVLKQCVFGMDNLIFYLKFKYDFNPCNYHFFFVFYVRFFYVSFTCKSNWVFGKNNKELSLAFFIDV